MDDFELELKQDFLAESEDMLANAEGAFLRLEKERDNAELLNEIFRIAHNLKGTSKAVGFDQMAELTHIAENLILKIQEGEVEINDAVVTLLLEFNDRVSQMIAALKEDLDATFNIADINEKLEAATRGEYCRVSDGGADQVVVEPVEQETPTADEFEATEVYQEEQVSAPPSADQFDAPIEQAPACEESNDAFEKNFGEMLASNSEADVAQELTEEFEQKLMEQHPVEPVKKPVATPAGLNIQPEKPTAKKTSAKPKNEETIRVSLSRIEKLNNLVGELVIIQTVLDQTRLTGNSSSDLINKSISQLGALSKEIQEISMSLRMIPLKTTFQKMSRIVRDTSKVLNKDVALNLVGEETEVDKTVLEHLSDPLVHIIRNAIDHGLETPEQRTAVGKDPQGVVEVMAYHEGSNLVIQITDDGNGIDPDVIRRKAIEKGLISEDKVISDDEMIQYIFHPGFSTKEQVSEVSGRGVGMDVVQTNIQNLSGEIKLMSKLGTGSSFKIVLPLTLAIIDGVVTACEDDKYIVPISQIQEFLKPTPEIIHHVSGLGNCLHLRGEVIPIMDLASKLGRRTTALQDQHAEDKIVIITKDSSGFSIAIQVDNIINQQQVVIKKIGDEIKNKKGMMGTSILGNGKPAFIIDLHELLKDHKSSTNFRQQRKAA
jgi:two-component system chemotaxis sensor kinase CheA